MLVRCVLDKKTFNTYRSEDEFQRAAIPGSYNIPYISAFASDGFLLPSRGLQVPSQAKTSLVVVVGIKQSKDDVNVSFLFQIIFER